MLAQTSTTDYWAFATFEASLYGFTSANERVLITSSLTASPTAYAANHLATDSANNRIIYALNELPNNASSDVVAIFEYDLATNTRTNITGTANLASTVGVSLGGGSFYDGAYYLWDDYGSAQGLVRFTFDSNGVINGSSKPYGNDNSIGLLGDIAIDRNGQLFILNADNELYRADLNNTSVSPTLVGDYSAYLGNGQLFVDADGQLISRADSSADWVILDPEQPGILGTLTGPSQFSAYSDLAEGGIVGVVPEPSATACLLLGGLLSTRRRRN
ncbi:PEP-CTERM sorting domain-containing protein [Roseibacillus ishigakijimensis]|nr:PEP-CTERM sorting domain-containing protein [Roseibacillus ishigakijimensis]